MSSLQIGHPEDEQLLRYADGELGAGDAARVRTHLESCWQCRTELAEIQKTMGECVAYRKQLQTHLAPPPAPWVDLHRRMAEIDTTGEGDRWFARVARWFPSRTRWLPAAVAAALLLGIYSQLRHTPSVEAAELLRKAVVAAENRPETHVKHIRIRTPRRHLTRVVGVQTVAGSERESTSEIEALFVAAHYNWEDPLSAKSYTAWRSQLSDKKDEVTQAADGFRIRTTSASSELQEATLRLNADDLRPVEERLQFRNQEWVEISEMSDAPAPAPVGGGNPVTQVLPPPHERTAVPEPVPAPPATAGEELQVLAALHQVGADLGDPIEVKREGSRILVNGVGVSAERERAIRESLGFMPNVVLEFSEPSAAKPGPAPAPVEVAAPKETARLQARVEQQLGGHAYFEQLATQVLDMSDTMMARVYALRRLAERFPEAAEANLAPAEQAVLRRLGREHVEVLSAQTAQLQRLLNPVLTSLGGPAATAAERRITADRWQPATEELFQAARQTETLAAAIFGGAPSPIADAQLPPELLASLASLRSCSDAYAQRLPPTPGERVK